MNEKKRGLKEVPQKMFLWGEEGSEYLWEVYERNFTLFHEQLKSNKV